MQKSLLLGGSGVDITDMVVAADEEPAELVAVAVYDVLDEGAATFTVQAEPGIALLHEHEETAVPPLQVIDNVTLVPAATGDAAVFGDWLTEHPLGGVVPGGGPMPM